MEIQESNTDLVFKVIRQLKRELHPELRTQPEVTLDSVLDRDLGLDSIARMELLARIEKSLRIRLPEKVLATAETPRDILRALGKYQELQDTPSSGVVLGDVTSDLSSDIPLGDAFLAKAREVKTLTELLIGHAATIPDKLHIYLEEFSGNDNTLTFGELFSGAKEMVAGLQRHNLDPGDTVAIMLPTGVDYFFSFFGILLAGCVPVPLYPPMRPSQIEEHLRRHKRILNNARAKILITIPEVRLIGKLLQTQIETLGAIVTPEELRDHELESPINPGRGNDTAFLQYTSGSTGDPKGVILTHSNLLANIRVMGEAIEVSSKDVFVSWLPLYHDMGLIGAWLGSLYYGCRLVVMSPLSFLARPERWLQTIHKHRGTLSASPNFGYEVCCRRIDDKAIEGLDLSSWRLAFNGAEPVSSNTLDSFYARFKLYGFRKMTLAPVYGLAESSVGLAFPPLNREPLFDRIRRDHFLRTGEATPAKPGEDGLTFVACGRPLRGHQIRIVDPEGRELPERHQGRLEFKGPSSTSGYLHNPDQTRKLFHGDWLDSGDLAYIADGDVYITSRVKDIIIKGGRNIHPHELEEAVGDIKGIRKGCVAVFASMDEKGSTERLVVLAETRVTKPETLEELRKSITNLGVDLLGVPPDDVILAPPGSVLKTSSGKIRRSSTRIFYERGLVGKKRRTVWMQIAYMTLAGIPGFSRKLFKKTSNYLYASYCWMLYGVLGLPLWILIITLPSKKLCWSLTHRFARLLTLLTGTRLDIQGLEHLSEPDAQVLVSNHMSYMDSFILTACLGAPVSIVGKAELAKRWWLRKPLEKIDVVFVERFETRQGVEDTKKLSQLVHSGKRLLFFAEGTIQRMPGLLPFQMGAFLTAAQNKTGIVPITIRGTRNKLRSGSWFPRRGPVSITISKPIMVKGDDWNGAVELRNKVRQEILRGVGEPDLAGEYTSIKQMEF